MKQNCWEFKKCGRESGGCKVHELGVCPASIEQKLDGIHEGKNSGRACWVVGGTYCKGEVQGNYAKKLSNCMECDFYKKVKSEESPFILSARLLVKLKG